ncbi:MAG: cupin domain-containing protein [Cyanobacteria bacterium]|nr:cupin domain-containing protein [Cyanobacteriota bacterium]
MEDINLEPEKFNEKEIKKKIFEDRWVRFAFGTQGFINTKNLNLGIVEFEKNKTSLTHTHDVEESLYVLAGKGIIDVDGTIYNIRKGDFIYIPKDSEHTIITGNNSRIRILFIFGGEIKIDY